MRGKEGKSLSRVLRSSFWMAFFVTALFLCGCGLRKEKGAQDAGGTEIQVFIAASLQNAMEEVKTAYCLEHPGVKVTLHADSSGTLMTQIEEGYVCDVFFSAAQEQMDRLEGKDRLVVEGTREDVVANQLCVITCQGSDTKVSGLGNIGEAGSIALADATVPAGRYTRVAMGNAGILQGEEDPAKMSAKEVSEQLGGVEISEQSNVSKVLAAVAERSCEVGTVYVSDVYGHEDRVEILEKIPCRLTGDIIYPIAQIRNEEAGEAEKAAALDFIGFVTSGKAQEIFRKYGFDVPAGD